MSTLRVGSEIVIGGTLDASLVDEMIEEAEMCGALVDLARAEVREAAELGLPLRLNAMIPSATWEELEDFCIAHGLTFWRSSDSCHEWDGQTTFWAPDGRHYDQVETANGTTVTLWSLESDLKDGKTLAEVVASLKCPTDCTEESVPPLVLIGKMEDEEDED